MDPQFIVYYGRDRYSLRLSLSTSVSQNNNSLDQWSSV